ncbi:MAG: hypothetical protein JO166_06890 [Deltaproteobacteria bacterium]|nr:hypothetical protein [Deltaproteobacteria bacterium]
MRRRLVYARLVFALNPEAFQGLILGCFLVAVGYGSRLGALSRRQNNHTAVGNRKIPIATQ